MLATEPATTQFCLSKGISEPRPVAGMSADQNSFLSNSSWPKPAMETRCGRWLLRDRLHHIVDRPRARDRPLHVLDQRIVVLGKCMQPRLGLHLHDLVAAGLQAAKQQRQCFRRVSLEIMHQDDALA